MGVKNIKDKEIEIQAMSEKLQEKETELSSIIQENDIKTNTFQNEKSELEEVIQRMKNDIELKDKELEEKMLSNERILKDISSLKKAKEKLMAWSEKVTAESEQNQAYSKEMELKVSEFRDANVKLSERIQSLVKENESKDGQIDDTK